MVIKSGFTHIRDHFRLTGGLLNSALALNKGRISWLKKLKFALSVKKSTRARLVQVVQRRELT